MDARHLVSRRTLTAPVVGCEQDWEDLKVGAPAVERTQSQMGLNSQRKSHEQTLKARSSCLAPKRKRGAGEGVAVTLNAEESNGLAVVCAVGECPVGLGRPTIHRPGGVVECSYCFPSNC